MTRFLLAATRIATSATIALAISNAANAQQAVHPSSVGKTALVAKSAPHARSSHERPAASAPAIAHIPMESFKLANGLTVILSVDHSAPVVAVDVEHHVGSKNEVAGRTGFAHLFEHVMFNGSAHIPYGVHDKLTEGVGGELNGSTDNDRTNFYESVPSNYLETQLWLESDRMGWLLDALDITKLNAQRDVVKSERRQRVDNVPFGRVGEIMDSQMYPEGHPYHWPIIGSMEDLSAASEADVKSFYKQWYGPNNSVLVIAGDFDAAQTRKWVQKYFGDIAAAPPVKRPVVATAKINAPTHLVYEDNVSQPQLYISWTGQNAKSADRAALTAMASIISGDRTQWLTQEFVYNRKWASALVLNPSFYEDVGDVSFLLVPTPGTDLTRLELAVDSVITRFKKDGPTAEQLAKDKARREVASYTRLQTMLGKATTLGSGWIFHGDGEFYATDIAESKAVTVEDVKRVANKYLVANRIVLSAVPTGKRELAAYASTATTVVSPFAAKEVKP